MKKILWMALIFCVFQIASASAEEVVTQEPFGEVHIYPPVQPPATNVVLMASGDGGWVRAVVELAESLSRQNSLVVGFSIKSYLRTLHKNAELCSTPASDFEQLGRWVEERYGVKPYSRPLLIGYSSGATLVYATLVQAPPNTFAGAISFGFCPDLPIAKPFCRGEALEWIDRPKGTGVSFLPAKNLQNPWIAFQGLTDQVCDADATEAFVNEVPNGEFVPLPKVGHGFSYLKNWMATFRQVFSRFNQQTQPSQEVEPSRLTASH